jgi:hypothetical protein
MRSEHNPTDTIGLILFALLTVLIAIRLTHSIDLSDESYYAIFLDDWLKGSIVTSTLLTLHQTAALVVYPAALAFEHLKGSNDGLFLFLRSLYLLGAIISAAVWVAFLRRLGYGFRAWAGGLFILAFIPFGLPAPSYNTLGQQAVTIALASFGCAALSTSKSSWSQLGWLTVSAVAWAIATVAYPTLIVPLAFVIVLGLLFRDGTYPRPWFCLTAIVLCVGMAWALVVLSLSFTRLYESLVYLSAINDPGGVGRKLEFALTTLRASLPFSMLLASALALGLLRQRLGPLTIQIALVGLITALFFIKPVLYARSHDVITLATLTGIGLLVGLRSEAHKIDRIVALVYAGSLVAASAICLTATNSVYNFCIGAGPAAALAVIGSPRTQAPEWFKPAPALAAILAALSTSLFHYYGEIPSQTVGERERFSKGIFAGISIQPDEAALLRLVQDRVAQMPGGDQRFAIFGRSPGIALAMPGRLSMLSAYPLVPTIAQKGLVTTHGFYAREDNRPPIVLIYRDIYFDPINPMQPDFDAWYALEAEFKTPLGQLAVFRRRSPQPRS